jgi:uncharacterized protein YqeY
LKIKKKAKRISVKIFKGTLQKQEISSNKKLMRNKKWTIYFKMIKKTNKINNQNNKHKFLAKINLHLLYMILLHKE